MARARRPGPVRVPIGLEVSAADAARIDEVLARPEFAGWTRAEWCLEIVRTALRYYVGNGAGAPEPPPGPDPGQAPAANPAAGVPVAPQPPPRPDPPPGPEPDLVQPEPWPDPPPGPEPDLVQPEPWPECPHPADARDYETGTCAACGAILWD